MPTNDDDTATHNANDTGSWHTIAEACELLNVSNRTLWRRIKQGNIKSKLEDGKRIVEMPGEYLIGVTTMTDDTVTGTPRGTPKHTSVQAELIQQLRSEVEYLRSELKQVNERYEQSQQRSDTIILQLTRQLGDAQKSLEARKQTWWRKLKLGKDKEEKQ